MMKPPARAKACSTLADSGGYGGGEVFAKAVKAMSGGKFEISVHAAGELMPAFGVVDGVQQGSIEMAHTVGYYFFGKHPGWWEGGPEVAAYVNKAAWEGLSAENKAILEAASALTTLDMTAKYDQLNPTALKQLVGAKTKVLPFSKEILDASFKAAMQTYDELDARNPAWKKIYADYRAFQKDQILWARFCESRFDQYMQTVKL